MGRLKCVAAGRAGGKTYAVFIREALAGRPTGDPFKSEAERDPCYRAKKRIVPCIFATTLEAYMHVGILVVDAEEGVGHLSIGYGIRPYHLNHSRFIFGDGVYLNIESFETLRYMGGLKAAVGAKREILGPLLEGCAYRVKIRLEPEKLTISQPLYNITTRAVRVGDAHLPAYTGRRLLHPSKQTLPLSTEHMLRFLTGFSTRCFLVLIIFIYIICFIGSLIFRGWPPQDLLFRSVETLIVAVFISPPLLSLFLMRRPSFACVLLHLASAFYMLFLVCILSSGPPSSPWDMVLFPLLVYSGAALVAGLPEAAAAGWWARLVYYAVLLFWLSLIVAPLVVALLS